ncbi:MAG: ATP phosphoribosyltransferase [Deltaproteobacteria bacterium RIFCSPLOWO2_01_44_7]|nr:MAG: ATP phosphoribosyltransferase [Deltaproteobacteria bacterium RIFCSPHIGHO2_01_FULL_43_49]OGQ38262.1 MAG: ATP phosphoribosyltransferase [Deltaproteobacteria bacterium RIFCSPLOWO2_01_44_7]OGQ43506.1 MAG: ATP phosphoribosyltransferase [Deltaproteobacteria bacterium RIFCSPLOWO2_02_FULL_44_34]
MKRNNIRIAIQKEGRLRNPSLEYLESLGLQFPKQNGRTLVVPCKNADAEILYVRHSDVPQYVQNGAADFAIVGGNVLYEKDFKIREVEKLNFGKCSLVIAVPLDSSIQKIQDLEGERIATSYPNSLRKFLRKQKINAAVIEIRGSVEVAPALGLADAICDLTQTGNTLKENSLKTIETLFDSMAVFIESPFESIRKDEFIKKFITTAI